MAPTSIPTEKIKPSKPVNLGLVAQLKRSLAEHGQLTPLRLTKRLRVRDGDHRLAAAKSLGLPTLLAYVEE